jgi:acyl-CoA reductase-like NAD-dependent aldehyde dehydrogenase
MERAENFIGGKWSWPEGAKEIVSVNPADTREVHMPFRGIKATGNGHREAGLAGLDILSLVIFLEGGYAESSLSSLTMFESQPGEAGNPKPSLRKGNR